MIKFPDSMVQLEYSGYFWCCTAKKLYSIKIGGELRELKQHRIFNPGRFGHGQQAYQLSVKGRRRNMLVDELMKLEPLTTVETLPTYDRK